MHAGAAIMALTAVERVDASGENAMKNQFALSIPTAPRRATFAVATLIALIGSGAPCQEQSVKPGINDSFRSPRVESFVERFEGESRVIFRYRRAIVEALGLETGTDVADVGAGTGLFTRLIAPKVGPEGKVYAVDIAEAFLEHIEKSSAEAGLENVKTVLASERSSKLDAESVDLVFICDTYHHFEFPYDTLASIHRALRPGGVLVIVDFERVRGVSRDWTLNHVRCGKGTVTDEVKDAGFEFVKEIPMMDEQYVLKFRKREPK